MKSVAKKSGLSLMEEVVVVATIALLIVFGVPAIRALFKSLESEGGAKSMISGALSTARAIAAKHQRYAGIRFQFAYYKDDPANSPLKASQYMIFIVQDPEIMAYGFRAVEGLQPIKLPDSVGVMDLRIRTNLSNADDPNDESVGDYSKINDPEELSDTTTFSIIFSPSGKLVIHDVRVRNRDGRIESTETTTLSKDDIFNTLTKITNSTNPYGMFVQDDYADDGFGKEPSRSSFIIYDRTIFEKLNPNSRYDDYLKYLEVIYINPYTGTMIEK